MKPASPGIIVPTAVQRADQMSQKVQFAISAVPECSTDDLLALQGVDPAISAVLPFRQQQQIPSRLKKQSLPPVALGLLRQWDRLVLRQGLLYRTYQRPVGGECIYQLVLPECLQEEVFQQLHTYHGHQGAERATELIQQRCYWPGMGRMIKDWCQICSRCSVAKNTQPQVRAKSWDLISPC